MLFLNVVIIGCRRYCHFCMLFFVLLTYNEYQFFDLQQLHIFAAKQHNYLY